MQDRCDNFVNTAKMDFVDAFIPRLYLVLFFFKLALWEGARAFTCSRLFIKALIQYEVSSTLKILLGFILTKSYQSTWTLAMSVIVHLVLKWNNKNIKSLIVILFKISFSSHQSRRIVTFRFPKTDVTNNIVGGITTAVGVSFVVVAPCHVYHHCPH